MREGQVRKVVTVLFADVIGSTALGEELDPETTRALMSRYFAMAQQVIEHHGGTVEKFVGDAVMAVFGVPTAHEDDALRAVRAATDMATGLAALNAALLDDLGVTIQVRTGINTGEVVSGTADAGRTLVTGDAVNVAARLEQSAAPGEILLGESTARLVRHAVALGPQRAVEARGTSTRVRARPVAPADLLPSGQGVAGEPAFVGREREVRRLLEAYEDAVEHRRCELFTLLGQAGVGKSRLLAEFVARVGNGPRVLRGRCLPYGDGITFWPLAESLRRAAEIDESDPSDVAAAKLRALVGGESAEAVAGPLASAIGLSTEPAARTEISWAIRKAFEHLAADRPVVAVFEDLHWAEPAFLDVVEQLADLSRGVPLLIVCPARPELLDRRTGWGGGKLNATTMLLEPLEPHDASRLIDALPGGAPLPRSLVTRIADAAEGNPLFVQEMVGMLVDEGVVREEGGSWIVDEPALARVTVPPTIQALLAARLDQLLVDERTVAGRASVVGRVFEADAVAAMAPEPLRPTVPDALVGLVRKELIVPERAQLSAGDAFKFRHILIRDAAYESLPKAERAELHERFAGWLEQVAGDRIVEYEAIVGYHLEEAHRYRRGLGSRDERTAALGRSAGTWLARAGRRALDREDAGAARTLLSRAVALLPDDDEHRLAASLALGDALVSGGDLGVAHEMLLDVAARADVDHPTIAAEARILAISAETLIVDKDPRSVRRGLARALCTLRRGDRSPRLRSLAWEYAGEANQNAGQLTEARRAYRIAIRHAERSGHPQQRYEATMALAHLGARSDMPVAEVLALMDRVGATIASTREHGTGLLALRSFVVAMDGRFEDARRSLAESVAIREELGVSTFHLSVTRGIIEGLAGDLVAAEEAFRTAIGRYEAVGAVAELPFLKARLAHVLALAGRNEEALTTAEDALATGTDIYTRVFGTGTRVLALARAGRVTEAETGARALAAWATTSGVSEISLLYGTVLEDLAEVLAIAGREDEARAVAADAISRYERKGNVAAVAVARARFAALLPYAKPSAPRELAEAPVADP